MATERLQVKNVKCGGCATRITDRLKQLNGVDSVEVDVAAGAVTICGEGFSSALLSDELAKLGYPVAK